MYKYTEDGNAVIVISPDAELFVGTVIANPSGRWNHYVQPWLDAGNTPEAWYSAEESKEAACITVKNIANKIITDKYPEWKQRNLLAETLELVNKQIAGETLTAEEQDVLDENNTEWDAIKTVRAYSDALEVDIKAGNSPDIHTGWPKL